MPVYNVFEIYPNGSLHDTGKTVDIADNKGPKEEVFKLYGFDKSSYHGYYSSEYRNDGIVITTSFHEGRKDVWILKLDDEVKEKGNDDGNS